ncbi:unnamed protein product [marine sediment metagenome]|uniref:Uncharacterized protein n=1 Tax=marine sediment metagenome TaxID=412755 RepID=X0U5G9_9ZZZZ
MSTIYKVRCINKQADFADLYFTERYTALTFIDRLKTEFKLDGDAPRYSLSERDLFESLDEADEIMEKLREDTDI